MINIKKRGVSLLSFERVHFLGFPGWGARAAVWGVTLEVLRLILI
jgi:hypothetical protein